MSGFLWLVFIWASQFACYWLGKSQGRIER